MIPAIVGLCGGIGWLPGSLISVWWLTPVQSRGVGDFIGTYLLMCLCTSLGASLFVFVPEARTAMRSILLGPADIMRANAVGVALGSLCVVAAWLSIGFQPEYLTMPAVASPLGAWLAVRRVASLGRSHRPGS